MQGPGAVEVAIPVMRNSTEHIPSPTIDVLNQSNSQPSSSKLTPTALPTISVTKPPAPRPVALPTPQDIAPLLSPPESRHSSVDNLDEDLESGSRINGVPEMAEDVGLVTSTRRTGRSKSPIRRETSDASGSALPLSPPPPMLPRSTHGINSSLSTKPASPPPIIPDLLADEPVVDSEPLAPSSPLTLVEEPLPIQSESETRTNEPVVLEQTEASQEEVEPDTTIRLVGGGGQAGVVQEPTVVSTAEEEEQAAIPPAQQDGELVSTDAESIPDTPVNKKGEKGHKKSKSSIASLKRLSQFGHRKKKSGSSTSSVKDGVTTPSTATQ